MLLYGLTVYLGLTSLSGVMRGMFIQPIFEVGVDLGIERRGFSLLVVFISLNVLLWAAFYIRRQFKVRVFFAVLLGFVSSMLCLLIRGSLIVVFLG
jgi:NADH:ubiquinone oxidoreductase subunit 5 (subunit L)/multisubunit Na+/H+ antiporter MnhA subunit